MKTAAARAFSVVGAFAIVTACASSPPPKAAEPEAPPLEIPRLPPPKEPAPRPTAREAPPLPTAADGEEADALPSPLALPCKSDAECMTHRCNMRFAKCAFPCKSDRDCVVGATCFTQGGPAMATCIPKPP